MNFDKYVNQVKSTLWTSTAMTVLVLSLLPAIFDDGHALYIDAHAVASFAVLLVVYAGAFNLFFGKFSSPTRFSVKMTVFSRSFATICAIPLLSTAIVVFINGQWLKAFVFLLFVPPIAQIMAFDGPIIFKSLPSTAGRRHAVLVAVLTFIVFLVTSHVWPDNLYLVTLLTGFTAGTLLYLSRKSSHVRWQSALAGVLLSVITCLEGQTLVEAFALTSNPPALAALLVLTLMAMTVVVAREERLTLNEFNERGYMDDADEFES